MSKLKRSLLILAIIAAIVVIVLLVRNAPEFEPPEETTTPHYEETTYNTAPGEETLETLEYTPYFTMPTEPENYPETAVSDTVTINQVPKDPNEVIDRTIAVDPTHPEYLEDDQYNPYISGEGKVYRNDKVITLALNDGTDGYSHKISFGAAFGTCNRFLYLNPVVEYAGKTGDDYYFYFETPLGGGLVHSFYNEAETEEPMTYTFERALEQRNEAQYESAQNPGVVWYTQGPIDRPVYLDAFVYSQEGCMIASVRLTIEKDETDGTYSITDLDNNNLLVQNELYPNYTAKELEYILGLNTETLMDSDKIGLTHLTTREVVMSADNCIIDLRPKELGLVYDEFVPLSGGMREHFYYATDTMDILAVTYKATFSSSFTFYYYVTKAPTEFSHGSYQYIGRDYHNFRTVEELQMSGWKRIE